MNRKLSVSRMAAYCALSLICFACSLPPSGERIDPGKRIYVLPGADEALDRAVANAESAGPQADPSRLASLRLTREAKDMIADGQTDRALDQLERAIEQNGDQGFSYLYLAHLYIESGDVSQGLVLLDRAEALLPHSRKLESVVTRMLGRAAEIAAVQRRDGP